jgi:hypothetical protein
MFTNLNEKGQALEYLVGNSPEELLNLIRSFDLPISIVSMYAIGSKHIAWILTTQKVVKVKRVAKSE